MIASKFRFTVNEIPSILDDDEARDQLTSGLGNAVSSLRVQPIDRLFDEMPDGVNDDGKGGDFGYTEPVMAHSWEDEVVDAALAEVLEPVARLIEAAIAKRLPWTWEGDTLYR